jgi:hypothetical protein
MICAPHPPAESSSKRSVLLWVRFEPTPGKLTPLVAEDMLGEAVVVPRLWEPAGTSGLRIRSAVSSSTAAIAAACSASCSQQQQQPNTVLKLIVFFSSNQ